MIDDSIKTNIKKNIPKPSEEEQITAKAKILCYFSLIRKKKFPPDTTLPELLKFLALMPASQRFISSVFYKKAHPNHGDQYSGRDLKRWAAIELGELFEEQGLIKEHRIKDFVGEYWHES